MQVSGSDQNLNQNLNQSTTHAVGQRLSNIGLSKLTDQTVIITAEVDHAVIFSAPLQLPRVLFGDPGDQ